MQSHYPQASFFDDAHRPWAAPLAQITQPSQQQRQFTYGAVGQQQQQHYAQQQQGHSFHPYQQQQRQQSRFAFAGATNQQQAYAHPQPRYNTFAGHSRATTANGWDAAPGGGVRSIWGDSQAQPAQVSLPGEAGAHSAWINGSLNQSANPVTLPASIGSFPSAFTRLPPVQPAQPQYVSNEWAVDGVVYDLAPKTSTIPPLLPIEHSAVLLSDLATEMVWEAVATGVAAENVKAPATREVSRPSLFNEIVSTNVNLASSTSSTASGYSTPATPELSIGVIGDRRLNQSWSSSSTPDCSAPATPEPISQGDIEMDGCSTGYAPRPIHFGQVRQPTVFPAQASTPFRQFVKQTLTHTLVAPEDLVLALYYVARIPSHAVIPPVSPSELDATLPAAQYEAQKAKAEQQAIKAAPFKLFLGALILANKTLQDNSFRNDTWAQVSGISLIEVNKLEAHVFGALGFDVAVRDDVWRTWTGVVIARSRSGRGETGLSVELTTALHRLRQAAKARGTNEVTFAPSPAKAAEFTAPATPAYSSRYDFVDLDQSGPLKSVHATAPSWAAREAAPSPSPLSRRTGAGYGMPTSFATGQGHYQQPAFFGFQSQQACY